MKMLIKFSVFRSPLRLVALVLLLGLKISVAAQTPVMTTFAGTGVYGHSGDGGPASAAGLKSPLAMCTDAAGNIYVADGPSKVRKIDLVGNISTVAGVDTFGYSGDGGPATDAQMNFPRGLAVDAVGNIYISDEMNNVVRKVDVLGNISTVVGTGALGFSGDGGPATAAQLNSPGEIAFDNTGNLYIADRYNAAIRKVTPAGIITTIAGTPGTLGYSGDGGPASAAAIGGVNGLCFDAAGNLYIAEGIPKTVIRKIGTDGNISRIAGDTSLTSTWSGEGMAATATRLTSSGGITVDASGQVFFVESFSNKVRKVDATGIVRAVAGTGVYGFGGDGGDPEAAKMKGPTSLMIAPDGSLLIADSGNSRLRRVGNSTSSVPSVVANRSMLLVPNPCSGRFRVSLSDSEEVVDVKLSDLTGAIKWQCHYRSGQFQRFAELYVPDAVPGLYLVTVSTKANSYTNTLEVIMN